MSTSRDDADHRLTSINLLTLITQLINHSQWIPEKISMCGSYVEISLNDVVSQRCHVSNAMKDIDEMTYRTACYAANRSVCFPETYQGSIIRIYTDDVHTGYVRLIRERDNTELQLSHVWTLTGNETLHGPAILTDKAQISLRNKYSLSNDADNVAGRESR